MISATTSGARTQEALYHVETDDENKTGFVAEKHFNKSQTAEIQKKIDRIITEINEDSSQTNDKIKNEKLRRLAWGIAYLALVALAIGVSIVLPPLGSGGVIAAACIGPPSVVLTIIPMHEILDRSHRIYNLEKEKSFNKVIRDDLQDQNSSFYREVVELEKHGSDVTFMYLKYNHPSRYDYHYLI